MVSVLEFKSSQERHIHRVTLSKGEVSRGGRGVGIPEGRTFELTSEGRLVNLTRSRGKRGELSRAQNSTRPCVGREAGAFDEKGNPTWLWGQCGWGGGRAGSS